MELFKKINRHFPREIADLFLKYEIPAPVTPPNIAAAVIIKGKDFAADLDKIVKKDMKTDIKFFDPSWLQSILAGANAAANPGAQQAPPPEETPPTKILGMPISMFILLLLLLIAVIWYFVIRKKNK